VLDVSNVEIAFQTTKKMEWYEIAAEVVQERMINENLHLGEVGNK